MIATRSTDTVPHTPALNALKHGLRSEALLLPGERAAAFHAQRDELFHLYQPCTVDEAFCVAQMAKLQWRIRRCDRWQEVYDDQQDALLSGDPGLDSGLCEPDAHRSLHRPMDCELHAGRMDRRLCRLRTKLFELQRLRRLNLIPGKNCIAQDYRVFLAAEQAATGCSEMKTSESTERAGIGQNSAAPGSAEAGSAMIEEKEKETRVEHPLTLLSVDHEWLQPMQPDLRWARSSAAPQVEANPAFAPVPLSR